MAAPPSAFQSLTTLLRQISLDDHEEVLKAANAVLKKSKTDIEALHVKVVALLKLDRYEDSLRVLEEGGERLKERAPLEWAYALYKVGRYADVDSVARKAGREGRGLRHVEAQTVRLLRVVPILYWSLYSKARKLTIRNSITAWKTSQRQQTSTINYPKTSPVRWRTRRMISGSTAAPQTHS
jgi:hypothetical protein